jgi:hypothetical protein
MTYLHTMAKVAFHYKMLANYFITTVFLAKSSEGNFPRGFAKTPEPRKFNTYHDFCNLEMDKASAIFIQSDDLCQNQR